MKELFFEESIPPEIKTKWDFTNIDPFDGRYLRQTTSKYLSFVEVMRPKLSEQSRAAATSNDIVSLAQSLQMKQATKDVFLINLKALLKTLIKLVDLYTETLQIGCTHSQHTLPIIFGFALSEWIADKWHQKIIGHN